MRKPGKIDKAAYKRYIKMYEAEKRDHNIIWGTRRYTYKQYVERRQLGYSNRNLVDAQARFNSEQKKAIWKSYKENRAVKPGESDFMSHSYWGSTRTWKGQVTDENDMRYHRTIGGLLGDENQIHLLITNRINAGERKEDVLESYGIIDY